MDKWETEGKITKANRNNTARYFELFEEHISPKSNALIAIGELKRLFQGSISLEDFHTKALRLVEEAEYPEGDTQNRVLRDTIISGLASDKIWAKIIKKGKDVTVARVMEIAWLEVSTQRHIDRMQETAKVNYVHYGKASKKAKGKPRPSGGSGSSSGSRVDAILGIKVERLVISILIHSIRVTSSWWLVSFYYTTGAAGCACRAVASSHLLVAVTSIISCGTWYLWWI